MNIVFVNVEAFSDQEYAPMFLKSIDAHMHGANIIQLSDRNGVKLPGVNEIVRGDFEYSREEYPKRFFKMVYDLGIDEILYSDADVLFVGDIEQALHGADWEVAICNRYPKDGTSDFYRKFYPYNLGFLITRTREFWKECDRKINEFKKCDADLAQYVAGWVIDNKDFKVKFLDGAIYNRTPKDAKDTDNSVKVWHFKGGRKKFMKEWMRNNGIGTV